MRTRQPEHSAELRGAQQRPGLSTSADIPVSQPRPFTLDSDFFPFSPQCADRHRLSPNAHVVFDSDGAKWSHCFDCGMPVALDEQPEHWLSTVCRHPLGTLSVLGLAAYTLWSFVQRVAL